MSTTNFAGGGTPSPRIAYYSPEKEPVRFTRQDITSMTPGKKQSGIFGRNRFGDGYWRLTTETFHAEPFSSFHPHQHVEQYSYLDINVNAVAQQPLNPVSY